MQGKTAKNERRRESRLIGDDCAAARALAAEALVMVYAGRSISTSSQEFLSLELGRSGRVLASLETDWRYLADILLTNASSWNRLN